MDHTRSFFDGYADRWDDVNRYDRTKDDFDRLIAKLDLTQGSNVVDLGCGTGVLIPYLLQAVGDVGKVLAVDISEKMLHQLSMKFPQQNVRTFPLKAEDLSSIKENADAVICFSAFPHVEGKKEALKEISSILKTGGRFLIAHFSSRKAINDFHAGLPEPICHHTLPTLEEMKQMLAEAGLELVSYIDEPSAYELLAKRRI